MSIIRPDSLVAGAAPVADRGSNLMVELAKVPSPQTELFEAEPLLRNFIQTAVAPRVRDDGVQGHPFRRHGKPDSQLWREPERRVADAVQQRHEPAAGDDEERLFRRHHRRAAARTAGRSGHGQGAERTEGDHGAPCCTPWTRSSAAASRSRVDWCSFAASPAKPAAMTRSGTWWRPRACARTCVCSAATATGSASAIAAASTCSSP